MKHYKSENGSLVLLEEIEDAINNDHTLEEVIDRKLYDINEYDNSSNVNSFTFNGNNYWLDKATRVGLVNSTNMLIQAEEENTTLWLNDVCVTLPCKQVLQILCALEVYALKCYNVTAQHKAEVSKLTSIEEVEAYDITSGYPDKLSF